MESKNIQSVGTIFGISILASSVAHFGFKTSGFKTFLASAVGAIVGVIIDSKIQGSGSEEEPTSSFSRADKNKGKGKPLSCWCTNKGGNGESKCPCGGHHGAI
jgi:hypothetical protein